MVSVSTDFAPSRFPRMDNEDGAGEVWVHTPTRTPLHAMTCQECCQVSVGPFVSQDPEHARCEACGWFGQTHFPGAGGGPRKRGLRGPRTVSRPLYVPAVARVLFGAHATGIMEAPCVLDQFKLEGTDTDTELPIDDSPVSPFDMATQGPFGTVFLDTCVTCGESSNHCFVDVDADRFRRILGTECLPACLAAFSLVDLFKVPRGEALSWLRRVAAIMAGHMPPEALCTSTFTVLTDPRFGAQERLLAAHVLATKIPFGVLRSQVVHALQHQGADLLGSLLLSLAKLIRPDASTDTGTPPCAPACAPACTDAGTEASTGVPDPESALGSADSDLGAGASAGASASTETSPGPNETPLIAALDDFGDLFMQHACDWCRILQLGAHTWGPAHSTLPWSAEGHKQVSGAALALAWLVVKWATPALGPEFAEAQIALLALVALAQLGAAPPVGPRWLASLAKAMERIDTTHNSTVSAALTLVFTELWRPCAIKQNAAFLGPVATIQLQAALTVRVSMLAADADSVPVLTAAHLATMADLAILKMVLQWPQGSAGPEAGHGPQTSPDASTLAHTTKPDPGHVSDWHRLGVCAACLLSGITPSSPVWNMATAWDLVHAAVRCGAFSEEQLGVIYEKNPGPVEGAVVAWTEMATKHNVSEDPVVLLALLLSIKQALDTKAGIALPTSSIEVLLAANNTLRAWTVIRCGCRLLHEGGFGK